MTRTLTHTRCSLCPGPGACNPVPSIGPAPTSVLLIGAGPGKTEARTGIPYTGQAGEELTETYLPLARLFRNSVHIANAQQCWWGEDKVQDKRLRECALTHLPALLDRVRPDVVVLMGSGPCKLADTRIRLDIQHGRPIYTGMMEGVWEGWVWPSYEPALGMRDTGKMTPLMDDFRHLGEWLRGEWEAPGSDTGHGPDPDRALDYALISTRDEVQEYVQRPNALVEWSGRPAVDTESHGQSPWSVQFSIAPRTGRLIRVESRDALHEFGMWAHGREVALHNSPGDLDLCDKLGICFDRDPDTGWDRGRYRDTMQEAYQLCALPQGLKALAYRLFGAAMRSWEDVVWPASVTAFNTWAEAAIEQARSHLSQAVVTTLVRARCIDCGHQHTTGACKRITDKLTGTGTGLVCGCKSNNHSTEKVEWKASVVEQVLKHIIRYTTGTVDADKPYHPWKALRRMRVEGLRGKCAEKWEWEVLEEWCGEVPVLGIGNVELDDAVQYGCGDADWTGRVAAELERQRGSERWKIAEEDRDR